MCQASFKLTGIWLKQGWAFKLSLSGEIKSAVELFFGDISDNMDNKSNTRTEQSNYDYFGFVNLFVLGLEMISVCISLNCVPTDNKHGPVNFEILFCFYEFVAPID